ncbi:hypothetical protein M9H77_06585 [Catharanthus roseus]|uniref:Uncharacterized protein n=1 Tax=Catharanthus roseus TaxID=4058 RepID=A0ACC0BSH0_CATRO|nr:hypothetical protein M9H77_06585 [Catharanthus roseus]
MHKRSLKGNLYRSKRSHKTTRVYEHVVIKLNTSKTRRLVRGILKEKSSWSFILIIIQRRRKEELVETNIVLYLSFLKLICIVEKGPYVPQKDGKVKKVGEFNEFDARKMTLNFQALNILSYALDANEYNRLSGCDSAHEITNHLVADCPKAIEKEKGALEAQLEAIKKKKKGNGLIGARDQDSSEGEEKANMCFMALENDNFKNFLENKNLCEKVLFLEKCMEDYNDLKKKVHKSSSTKWYLSGGCSRHMTSNASLISELKETESGFVTFGNKKKGKIIGIGNIGNGSSSFIKNLFLKVTLLLSFISMKTKLFCCKKSWKCLCLLS